MIVELFGRIFSFTGGLIVGGMVGATIGWLIASAIAVSRMAELQEMMDARAAGWDADAVRQTVEPAP